MLKNIQQFINRMKPASAPELKRCSISNRLFEANSENFYKNKLSRDGLHPYHKAYDNFRRANKLSVKQVYKLVSLLNTY